MLFITILADIPMGLIITATCLFPIWLVLCIITRQKRHLLPDNKGIRFLALNYLTELLSMVYFIVVFWSSSFLPHISADNGPAFTSPAVSIAVNASSMISRKRIHHYVQYSHL